MAGDASTDDLTGAGLADARVADARVADARVADAGVPGEPITRDATGEQGPRCPFAPPPTPGSPPKPKRGYLLPGTIALVVCAGIATVIDLAGLQSHTPSNLAGRQVETFLSQSLQANHPQNEPPQVRCPAEEPLRAGLSFDCMLLRAGRPAAAIRVTETSADGTFRYRPPASG